MLFQLIEEFCFCKAGVLGILKIRLWKTSSRGACVVICKGAAYVVSFGFLGHCVFKEVSWLPYWDYPKGCSRKEISLPLGSQFTERNILNLDLLRPLQIDFSLRRIFFFFLIFFSQVESESQVESSLYFGSEIKVESSLYFGSEFKVESSLYFDNGIRFGSKI